MTRKRSILVTTILFLTLTVIVSVQVRAQAFDYSVSVDPTSDTVNRGRSISATLTATLTDVPSQAVNFTVSGLPTGVNATFAPNTYCVPTCSLTLTFAASSTATLGTFPVTVRGNVTTATPSNDQVTFTLTVDTAEVIIEPAATIDVPTGEIFDFNVTVIDVVDLFGWQVNVTYSPTIITLTDLAFSPYWANLVPTGCGFGIIQRDETAGWFSAAATQFDLPGCPGSVNGTSGLVMGNFTVNTLGQTPIRFERGDTILSDRLANPMPYTAKDGSFSNLGLVPKHDLVITIFQVDPLEVFINGVVKVTIFIKNQGNVEESFDVKATANNTEIGVSRITNLSPGASRSAVYSWNTTSSPAGKYTVKAEAILDTGLVDETPANNTKTQLLTVRAPPAPQATAGPPDIALYIIAGVIGGVVVLAGAYVFISRGRKAEKQ